MGLGSVRIDVNLFVLFLVDNSHTPPPPYSSMPFSSPPPRYVSVLGLNSDTSRGNRGHKKSGSSTCKSASSAQNLTPKVFPIAMGNSSFVEEEESTSGLPSYEEALNREHQSDCNTVENVSATVESDNTNVMRVSMV